MESQRPQMPPEAIEAYNLYIHGEIDRRSFFDRLSKVTVAGMGGKLDLGVELAERRFHKGQTADYPGLPRSQLLSPRAQRRCHEAMIHWRQSVRWGGGY